MIDGRRGQPPGTESDTASEGDTTAENVALEPVAEGEAGGDQATPATDAPGRRLNLGRRLVRMGVTADQVTLLGLALAGVTAVAIGLGHLWIGVALVTVGGLMDFLDGAVAKAAGTASKRGAFFDSVSDRIADGLIFGGLAWYFATGSQPRLALLPFAIFGVGVVISYERAKAESLGYDARGGLMERAERLILLGIALAFNVVLVPLLFVLLGLSVVTAGQRFAKVWRQASAPEGAAGGAAGGTSGAAAVSAWRRGRVESRWRARRQDRSAAPDRRSATAFRARARRRNERIGTRLRRVLASDRSAAGRASGRETRRRQGSVSALRRRLGPDR